MNKQDCLAIGEIVKTHGIHGELVLELYNAEWSKNIKESIFLEVDGLLVPFFIAQISPISKERWRVKFDWVDNETKAGKLCQTTAFIESSQVAISKKEILKSFDSLIGFQAFDTNYGELGIIIDTITDTNNPLLVIDFNDHEMLIPLHPDLIDSIDSKRKTIALHCPLGLIEMYQ